MIGDSYSITRSRVQKNPRDTRGSQRPPSPAWQPIAHRSTKASLETYSQPGCFGGPKSSAPGRFKLEGHAASPAPNPLSKAWTSTRPAEGSQQQTDSLWRRQFLYPKIKNLPGGGPGR